MTVTKHSGYGITRGGLNKVHFDTYRTETTNGYYSVGSPDILTNGRILWIDRKTFNFSYFICIIAMNQKIDHVIEFFLRIKSTGLDTEISRLRFFFPEICTFFFNCESDVIFPSLTK